MKNNFGHTLPYSDIHTHIGQFKQTYYDYHNVFSALRNNGICRTTFAYLTPLFTETSAAIEFYKAMTEETIEAVAFAKKIGLKVNPLYWIDPMVLFGGITLESILNDLDYKGLVVHPFLNDWNPSDEKRANLLTQIFEFAEKKNYEIYFHTGCSERDNPLNFEKWFVEYPQVKVHLAHCKDPEPIIKLFSKCKNLVGDTAFCPQDSYEAICKAGFKDRMFFGTDFPISHWYQHCGEENFPADEQVLTESYRKTLKEYEEILSMK